MICLDCLALPFSHKTDTVKTYMFYFSSPISQCYVVGVFKPLNSGSAVECTTIVLPQDIYSTSFFLSNFTVPLAGRCEPFNPGSVGKCDTIVLLPLAIYSSSFFFSNFIVPLAGRFEHLNSGSVVECTAIVLLPQDIFPSFFSSPISQFYVIGGYEP